MTSWMIEALSNELKENARNVIAEHLLPDIGFESLPRPAEFNFTVTGLVLAAQSLLKDPERADDGAFERKAH